MTLQDVKQGHLRTAGRRRRTRFMPIRNTLWCACARTPHHQHRRCIEASFPGPLSPVAGGAALCMLITAGGEREVRSGPRVQIWVRGGGKDACYGTRRAAAFVMRMGHGTHPILGCKRSKRDGTSGRWRHLFGFWIFGRPGGAFSCPVGPPVCLNFANLWRLRLNQCLAAGRMGDGNFET